MIDYECEICGCEFAVNEEYIIQMEIDGRYLSCPRHAKHTRIKKRTDYKKLMENRSAVQL